MRKWRSPLLGNAAALTVGLTLFRFWPEVKYHRKKY
jgi:hypothetical protein